MLHGFLHLLVPLFVALVLYRPEAARAAIILVATSAVDFDHLLADPVYDAARCSIGFHPLHSVLAISVYFLLFAIPLVRAKRFGVSGLRSSWRVAHLIGLGLLIHMVLDWGDCIL